MDYFFPNTRQSRLITACKYFEENKIYVIVKYVSKEKFFFMNGLVTFYDNDQLTINNYKSVPYKYVTHINVPTKNNNAKIGNIFFNAIKSNEGIKIYCHNVEYKDLKITNVSDIEVTFLSNDVNTSVYYGDILSISIETINVSTGGKNKKSRKNKKSLKSKKQNNNKKSKKQNNNKKSKKQRK